MTKLSVNINKVATLRNARGGAIPNVINFAKDCERFGADGITVHPRPDERHITEQDVFDLKKVVTTEFNIEGFPDSRFMQLVLDVKPEQVTLVPDNPHIITSNQGWDVQQNLNFLSEIIKELQSFGIRVSLFVNPEMHQITYAKKTGAERIELYTGPYAHEFTIDKTQSIINYQESATLAKKLGLGINAGHDLNLENLKYFKSQLIQLDEVSIGHALISDALYFGIENTIQLYKRQIQ